MNMQPYIIILGSLASLGIVSGGLGYLIGQFRTGTKKAYSDSSEIITFYKTENQSLKDIMSEKDKSNDSKFQQLTSEIGEIRGQLIEKEKQNKQYLDILQNRDPDTQKFQTAMVDGMAKFATILGEIHTLAIEEHNRDLSITSIVSKSN
jgi:hypothetical protein